MEICQQAIIILLAIFATVLTRFVPFIIFPNEEKTPEYIKYLGTVLPPAIFGLLVIYTVKSVDIFTGSHGIPELICIAITVGVHYWKKNMILSILAGTVFYMLIINLL